MDLIEALEWLAGKRSMTNIIPQDPLETWQVRICQADAAMTKQAYWIARAYDIDPYYLLFLFSHELTQQQLFNKVMIDTTLPNIGDRWQELNLPIARDKNERKKIKEMVKNVFEKRWEAEVGMNEIKSQYGNITT